MDSSKITRSNWNWRRASSTARRVSHERKSTSRHSDLKYSRNGRNEELKNYEWTNSLSKNSERKSSDNKKAHFTNTTVSREGELHERVSREGELHERFRRVSRFGIELRWKNFSRSQSTIIHSKSTIYAKPRQTLAIYTWNLSKSQGNVFGDFQ